MAISANEITLVFSGGASNYDPRNSIGGDPSGYPIPIGGKNNLFPNISSSEALVGRTDFRCVYLFNNSTIDTFGDVSVFVSGQVTGGADVSLGLIAQNDVQLILITGLASGGSFSLNYTDLSGSYTATADYDADFSAFAINIQEALLSQTPLQGATVTGSTQTDSLLFTVTFAGVDGFRFQELMGVASNSLSGSPTILISKAVDGAPINSIAIMLPSDISIPPSVQFYDTTANSPLVIGDLRPGDGVPIWVMRVVGSSSQAVVNDGFVLQVAGNPLG